MRTPHTLFCRWSSSSKYTHNVRIHSLFRHTHKLTYIHTGHSVVGRAVYNTHITLTYKHTHTHTNTITHLNADTRAHWSFRLWFNSLKHQTHTHIHWRTHAHTYTSRRRSFHCWSSSLKNTQHTCILTHTHTHTDTLTQIHTGHSVVSYTHPPLLTLTSTLHTGYSVVGQAVGVTRIHTHAQT